MIMNWLTNRWILCGLCVFATLLEMILAKKLYLPYTKKIQNDKVRTAVNLVLGVVLSVAFSAVQMWALCDTFGGTFYWRFVFASGLIATFLYLCYEKVFKNAEDTALGKVFIEVLKRTNLFDGKVSKSSAVALANKLHELVSKVDAQPVAKEEKGVETVIANLSKLVADGELTADEKVEADTVLKDVDLSKVEGHDVYKHYRELLKK